MKFRIGGALACLTILATTPCNASVVTVTYSGVVTAGTTESPVGSSFTGSFSYETDSTPQYYYLDSWGEIAGYTENVTYELSFPSESESYWKYPNLALLNSFSDAGGPDYIRFWPLNDGLSGYHTYSEILLVASDPFLFDSIKLPNHLDLSMFAVATANLEFPNAQHSLSGTITSLSSTIAVPEPNTWVMMVLGFGLVGTISRHRRPNKSVTAG